MRALGVAAALLFLTLVAGPGEAGAAGVAPMEGRWLGITSAGLPVSFEVAGGRVANTFFKFSWGFCGTYENHDPRADLEIDQNGRWAFEDTRGQTLEGTFVAPDRVEGKVISVERMLPGCPRTEATFTATPVPPGPETLDAARAGIEALPYRMRLRQPPGVENTLIGNVIGRRGETVRFVLFVNRSPTARLPGLPWYRPTRAAVAGGLLAEADFIFSKRPPRRESRAKRRERAQILVAIADPICLRQTGEVCPRS